MYDTHGRSEATMAERVEYYRRFFSTDDGGAISCSLLLAESKLELELILICRISDC